jgi:hypothetical protein
MKTDNLIKKLSRIQAHDFGGDGRPSDLELEFYQRYHDELSFASPIPIAHKENYSQMLSFLQPDDVLCDMGSCYLQFPLLASAKCRKVYAVELNPIVISKALRAVGYLMPINLIVTCAEWHQFPVPADVTVISCLVNGAVIPITRWLEGGRRVYHGTVGENPKVVRIAAPGKNSEERYNFTSR